MKEIAKTTDQEIKQLAKAIAAAAVRNTYLEDLHAGHTPDSETGDYSDVKVVSPHGEIPWTKLSRLNDDEMKRLMKQVVDRLYTCLRFLLTDPDNQRFHQLIAHALRFTSNWDEPEVDEAIIPSIGSPNE